MLRAAANILKDPSSSPALIAVAVVALCEVIDQQLPIPEDTAALLWAVTERNGQATWTSTATAAIGLVAPQDVVTQVLECLGNKNVGADLACAALDVLAGSSAVKHIADNDLLTICERARGRLVHQTANVVRATCDQRRVPQDVLVGIVGMLSLRSDTESKLAALELIDLLVDKTMAQKLVEHALLDEAARVRAAAALKIGDLYEREDGLGVVDRALQGETHNAVIAELLQVKSELLKSRPKGDYQPPPLNT